MAQRNRSVILTGAAGGVGLATVRLLIGKGYTVYGGAMDEWEIGELEKLKTELRTEKLIPVMLNLREDEQINAVVEKVEKENPDFAALIPNGAACPTGIPFEHMDMSVFEEVIQTNVVGNLKLIQRTLPLLKANKGRIIMVGSIWGKSAPPLQVSYAASKHAMEAYTHILRRELRHTGIKVSILNPEVIRRTYMAYGLHEGMKDVLGQIDRCPPDKISNTRYEVSGNKKLTQSKLKADSKYRKMYQTQLNGIAFGLKHGVKPESCAKSILHAIESPKPKTSYWHGIPAYIMLILDWLLPASWMDLVYMASGYRVPPAKGVGSESVQNGAR